MVKKPRNKKPNNKGSALFYVMLMLMVVTIILSGALYASYRNALVTNNYSSSESDYVACDSALEALRGQLAARLDGKNTSDFNEWILYGKNGFGKETVLNGRYTFYYTNVLPEEFADLIVAEQTLEVIMNTNDLTISVTAKYGQVSINTDIVIPIAADGKFGEVQFQNYKITSVIPEQTPDNPEEGGEQQ